MIKLEEQGRSMVEMLGVLAVMGVLSVSGVAMYTSAMNKHRANELLNAVSVRATALASQRMTGKALSLAGFTDNTQGTSVIDVNSSNAGAIEITISNVPLSVCKNMYNTRGANVIEMKSGTTVLNGAGACEEGATVSIKFNNDLSKSGSFGGGSGSGNNETNVDDGFRPACKTDSDCGECGECAYGECFRTLDGENCTACSESEITTDYSEEGYEAPLTCESCDLLYAIPAINAPNCGTECGGKREIIGSGENALCVLKNCPTGWNRAENGNCIQANLEGCAYFGGSSCKPCTVEINYVCDSSYCISECKKCNRVLAYSDGAYLCSPYCPAGTRMNPTTRVCEEAEPTQNFQ